MSLAPFRLDVRAAVVTGGLGQRGVEFTRVPLEAGARVAVLDVAVGERTVAEWLGSLVGSPDLMSVRRDITDRSSPRAASA